MVSVQAHTRAHTRRAPAPPCLPVSALPYLLQLLKLVHAAGAAPGRSGGRPGGRGRHLADLPAREAGSCSLRSLAQWEASAQWRRWRACGWVRCGEEACEGLDCDITGSNGRMALTRAPTVIRSAIQLPVSSARGGEKVQHEDGSQSQSRRRRAWMCRRAAAVAAALARMHRCPHHSRGAHERCCPDVREDACSGASTPKHEDRGRVHDGNGVPGAGRRHNHLVGGKQRPGGSCRVEQPGVVQQLPVGGLPAKQEKAAAHHASGVARARSGRVGTISVAEERPPVQCRVVLPGVIQQGRAGGAAKQEGSAVRRHIANQCASSGGRLGAEQGGVCC